jgi:hypothetical protein
MASGQSLILSHSRVEYSKDSSWVFRSSSCIRLVSSSLTSGGRGVDVAAWTGAVMLGLSVCGIAGFSYPDRAFFLVSVSAIF